MLAEIPEQNTKIIPKNSETSLKWPPEGTWRPGGSEPAEKSKCFLNIREI